MAEPPSSLHGSTQTTDQRLRLLLDTLPHIAFVIGADGNAECYNQAFLDYCGCTPGPGRADRTALHHPDDQPALETARRGAAAGRREYVVEARIRRHDGAYRWHRIHNKPLLLDGRPTAWLGTAVDIHDAREAAAVLEARVRERTAALERANLRLTREIRQRETAEQVLRDSEARYRMLYNRTPMALHSVDSAARLIDVNDTWLAMFGYPRDQVIGHSPTNFMTLASAEKYRTHAWPEMLGGDDAVHVVDYRFMTRTGEIFDGRLSARAEIDAEGRFVRSWSAIADITAETRADQELRRVQRLEAVGQLTAGIAHDFNNLLTAVLANLELLEQRLPPDNERWQPFVGGAQAAARRGAALVAQLLAFSRRQGIETERLDLNALVEDTMPLLRGTIGANIQISAEISPHLWGAEADPTQLELAIINLAINARDAMPRGGTLRLRTANTSLGEPEQPENPPAGDYVTVTVIDDGEGMPAEVRARIFEPFFTTKDVGKGSGLGLPQVLGMARQLGGGLSVASASGHGTAVSIHLPRAGAKPQIPPKPSS